MLTMQQAKQNSTAEHPSQHGTLKLLRQPTEKKQLGEYTRLKVDAHSMNLVVYSQYRPNIYMHHYYRIISVLESFETFTLRPIS